MIKEKIKAYGLSLGVDDVGFASISDYHSPKSYPIDTFLPGAKTIIALVFEDVGVVSDSSTIAMNNRLDMNAFQRSCSYQITRFIAREFKARTLSMPYSYPMEQHKERLALADFSQRHAAVAAGMGMLGRNNLVIHPKFGSKIGLLALITELELEPSRKLEQDVCTDCGLCVKNCPANALADPGRTNVGRCIKHSQPYGLGSNISFWQEFARSDLEQQQQMFNQERYWRMQQADSLGMQYYCFNCIKSCPIGQG